MKQRESKEEQVRTVHIIFTKDDRDVAFSYAQRRNLGL